MNRYIQATDAIRTPSKLKRAVCSAKPRRPLWVGAAAAVTSAAIMLAVLFWPAPTEEPEQNNFPLNNPLITRAGAAELIAEPEYPEEVQWELRPEDDSALHDFYYDTAREFLSDTGTENRLYSPLNLYLALGMLAEVTEGESRAQILDLLNCETMEELRNFVIDLWNANYRDDDYITSRLSSSLWLRDDMEYNPDTMQTLADTYYASSYAGTMGSEAMNDAFRDWLNDATGDLLSDQINDLELDADTVLALVSAIYFEASWEDKFSEARTEPDTFHSPGGDVTVDFLNQKTDRNYFWGENFSAVSLYLAQSGRMWILLPDEDSSVDELLSGDALSLVIDPRSWETQEYLEVDLSIPKFDVSCQIDLKEGLKKLGITNVFSGQTADFSPVSGDGSDLVLSTAIHGARAMIDEEGCLGAGYTDLGTVALAAIDPEIQEVAFTADRPFLFAITGVDGQILFLGVVNEP